jgi:hypothetical protein
MIINVTEEDIKNGVPRNSTCCPIALAIKRQNNNRPLDIGLYGIFRYNKASIIFPVEVTLFIQNFDMGGPVQPFSFECPLES